jgi:hypothetical protein
MDMAGAPATLRSIRERLWAIDVRALHAFRVGLALILLCDLSNRARDLQAHYTDAGVMPREALLTLSNNPYHFSLHLLSGHVAFQGALFILAAVCAFALLVGYRTWLATFLSWVLISSLHARNPLITNGGDTLLRLYLFWAMFVPLGRTPARAGGGASARATFVSWGSAALLLQVAIVYLFTAALKSHPWWTTEGTAIYYALNVDYMATPFGNALLEFPLLLRVLTHGVYFLEWAGPLLIFLPWKTERWRIAMVTAFWGMHLGIFLCMELGLFPWVSMVGWVLFLPPAFWDRVERWRGGSRLVAAFSGAFANGGLARYRHAGPQWVCALALLYVVGWNCRGLHTRSGERIATRWFDIPGRLLWLDQKWSMFAPRPPPESGRFVIPTRLRNGRAIDLFRNGRAVSWNKPDFVSEDFSNHRWRKYMANIATRRFERHREYYARYLIRTWDSRHSVPYRIQSFAIYYVRQMALPDGEKTPDKRTPLYLYRRPAPKKPSPKPAERIDEKAPQIVAAAEATGTEAHDDDTRPSDGRP